MSNRLLWRHAVAHSVAGLAFAAVATVLLLRFGGMEFLPLRTAVVLWAHAWPTVLILGLLVGRDRRLQALIVLGYLGVLAIICAVAELRGTPPLPMFGVTVPGFVQPAIIWLLNAAPSVFLLLFLNRTIRSIGPLVLLFVFVMLLGSHAATTLMLFDERPRRGRDGRRRAEHRRRLRSSGSCRRSARWSCSGRPGAASPGCATATPPSDRANCC